MADYDVFNGDADGICALLQLRLDEPRKSELITGVKRDIQLLQRVSVQAGDRVTVLDVSLDKNREALEQVLDAGARVLYIDHHYAGEVPRHSALKTHIDTRSEICSATLVNDLIDGRHWRWAAVGAFGDNFPQVARRLTEANSLNEDDTAVLQQLGTYINYNGYGASVADLHFAPDELFNTLLPHTDPLAFVAEDRDSFERLEFGYHEDMAAAKAVHAHHENERTAVFILPAEPWARRVSGVYGNALSNARPERAHAVLTARENGNYLVSVRAPLERRSGADELCRRFATGGGRAAAAGINDLPGDELQRFIDAFDHFYA